MKKGLSIFSISLRILLSAFNDDFFDRFPKTSIGVENFYNTEQDLKLFSYSFYDFPDVWEYWEDGIGTDNMANTESYEMRNIMLSVNPSSSTVTSGWTWGKLSSINHFLDNFSKADISEEALAHYEGIARFFRAKFYMEKVKRFSDVPWYDTEIGTGDSILLYKASDPRDMVVQNLFDDYEFAVNNVLADEQPVGAVNRWVALAYQARHALHEGTYRTYHSELNLESSANTYLQIARDAAKEIIDNGGYSIHNTGNPQSDYGSLFTNTNLSINSEVILVNDAEYPIKTHASGGFFVNEITFGDYDVSPSKELLQDYLMTDGTPYTQQAGYETKTFLEEFVNRDPRLSQTYSYPGWSNYWDENFLPVLQQNFTGYKNIKSWVDSDLLEVYGSVDFPVVRYAEILLIYAEARAELGELTQGDLDITINELRDRVALPHLSMGVAVDPVQQARYPNVSSTQLGELLEIRRERRVELALEGYRFDDLMRWAASDLVENEPKGMYFPGLGNYDLSGDGVDDIKLIDVSESIPPTEEMEKNSLDVTLIYYRVGPVDSNASFWLTNGNEGTIVSDVDRGIFVEPKYYYRPIPEKQIQLNPNLTQIFDWN